MHRSVEEVFHARVIAVLLRCRARSALDSAIHHRCHAEPCKLFWRLGVGTPQPTRYSRNLNRQDLSLMRVAA